MLGVVALLSRYRSILHVLATGQLLGSREIGNIEASTDLEGQLVKQAWN
jgi:hypothetical protein